jgi:hypothetical protein
VRHLLLIGLTLGLGCAGVYQVKATDATAGAPHHGEVHWSYLWSVFPANIDAGNLCHGNALANVKTETNLGFELLSLVTLGTVTPVTVSFDCAAGQ